jgi:hypothetical protein
LINRQLIDRRLIDRQLIDTQIDRHTDWSTHRLIDPNNWSKIVMRVVLTLDDERMELLPLVRLG